MHSYFRTSLTEIKLISMKKLLLLTFSLLLTATFATAQEFTMNDGNFTTCSGDFTDSGGLAGNYSNGENSIITFCSPFSTDDVQATFTLWNVGSGDILLAYDGDTATGSPIGVFNSAIAPTVITATAANVSGCLTFRFISNTSSVAPGWQATLACVDNCQTISNAVTTTPAPENDGVLRICQGDTVNFSGTTTFSVDGTGATNEWRFSDDPAATVTGTTASRTYNDPGIYRVDYVTTDPTECRDRLLEDVVILVSTTPDFTGTAATDVSLCFGESTTITGLVSTVEFVADVAPPVTGQTFLPDGPNDPEYETCIDVQGFGPGTTMQSVSDLISVFIDMEHSYMGDLDITLTAPNGASIKFLTFPNGGGGTYFGIPIDIDTDLNPGVGFVYNFTDSATQTLDAASAGVGTLPAGDYAPEDPFSDLIGTSLNGLWCLTIVDNLASDNGYIFEWGINFNPAIVPIAERYEPGEVTDQWLTNADITATNGSDITVTPTASGQNCYDFEFTDSFGCTYIETVCIEVAPEITSVQPTDIIVCQTATAVTVDLTSKDDEIRNGLVAIDYDVTYFNSDADALADTNPILNTTAFPVSGNITVWARVFDNVNGCFKTEQVNVQFQESIYNAVPAIELCDDLSGDQIESFDLTTQIAGILGSQAGTDFNIAFFNTQLDADDNMNAIATPAAYDNVSNPETIFVRISNAQDQDCFATGQFIIEVLSAPSIGIVADVSDCATDPVSNLLDLSLADYDAAVLNGQSAAAFTVTYHNSEANAISGVSALSSPYASSDQETIYARIVDNDSGCFDFTSFNVTVEVCEVVIPEGFSPNGDGINDTFSMPNIEQFPNFELTIFNRNGSSVYETSATNYIEFAGIPNTGALAGDGLLPVGTYFYVLKYNDRETEDVASWVYINY